MRRKGSRTNTQRQKTRVVSFGLEDYALVPGRSGTENIPAKLKGAKVNNC